SKFGFRVRVTPPQQAAPTNEVKPFDGHHEVNVESSRDTVQIPVSLAKAVSPPDAMKCVLPELGQQVETGTVALAALHPDVQGAPGVLTNSGLRSAAAISDQPEDVQKKESAKPKRARTKPAHARTLIVESTGLSEAHSAIDTLRRISPLDPFRKRALEIV